MKVSHEVPISLLERSRSFNDYDYALVHLFDKYPNYYEFFKESLRRGREVYLDNSIFELGHSFEMESYMEWIDKLNPTTYILPDALEDSKQTIKNFNRWFKFHEPFLQERLGEKKGRTMGVLQGNTYHQIVDCYKAMCYRCDVIGVSFDYSYYQKKHSVSSNKYISWMIGRVNLIHQLASESFFDPNIPIHLLGASLPQEVLYYRDFKFIESIDTSNPIVHGILGIKYDGWGLLDKQSIKLADLIDTDLTPTQKNLVLDNVKVFKEMATWTH